MIKYLKLIVLLLCVTGIGAQVDVAFSPDFYNSANLTEADKNKITAGLATQLNNYKKMGRLVNPETRKVDDVAIQEFRKLFQNWDVYVFNDAQEFPDMVSLRTYTDRVRTYLRNTGLNFDIREATIVSVQPIVGANGRMDVKVEVPKQVFNYYRGGGQPENKSKFYQLEFMYRLKVDEADQATIQSVRPKAGKAAEPYTRIINLGLGAGLGLTGGSESDLFNSAANNGSISSSGGLELNAGVSLLTNFITPKAAANKALFLNVGADVFFSKLEGTLNDYATSDAINLTVQNTVNGQVNMVNSSQEERSARNVNVVESQSLVGLRIPLGVAYRLLNKDQTSAFVSLQYAPGLILSSSGSLNDEANGDYNFNFTVDGQVFDTGSDNFYAGQGGSPTAFESAWGIGENQPIAADPTLETQFFHGVKISALYLKDLATNSPTFGLGVGLHVYLPLTSPFANDESVDQPFLYNNRPEYVDRGTLTPFLQNGTVGYFGISLNVYTKATRKP